VEQCLQVARACEYHIVQVRQYVVNLLKDDQGQDPEREKVYEVDVRIEAVQYYIRCKGTGTLKIALRDRHSLLSAGTLIIRLATR
jgi:hypothetical protein